MPRQVTNAAIADKLDVLSQDIRLVKELLTGNGDPKKGLIVQVDRLNQIEATRKWTIRALVTAILANGGSYFFK